MIHEDCLVISSITCEPFFPVCCSCCGCGPLRSTITFQGLIYCNACGEITMARIKYRTRDCRVYLPETQYWSRDNTLINVTGIHWLRENGTFLGTEMTIMAQSFPPPRGEVYIVYIRQPYRFSDMEDANALIVESPADYNLWAGYFQRPTDSVVLYRVKKLLLVPYTNFPLF